MPRPPVTERRVAGLNIAEAGTADGPTLLLLHGLGATWRVWNPVVAQLAQTTRVVAVDLPGFGRSPELHPERYDLADVSDALDQLVDELDVETVSVAGHSMGGGIAAHFASEFPDRVERLVLVAPAGFRHVGGSGVARSLWSRPRALAALRKASLLAVPAVAVSSRVRAHAFRNLFHDINNLERAEAVALVLGWTSANALGPAGTTIVTDQLSARIPKITMPTLVIWGEDDRVVSSKSARELTAALPDAELMMLEHTGHMPMHERPQEMADAISSFVLTGTAGTGSTTR